MENIVNYNLRGVIMDLDDVSDPKENDVVTLCDKSEKYVSSYIRLNNTWIKYEHEMSKTPHTTTLNF